MIAVEGGFQHAAVFCNAATLLIRGGLAAAVAMGIEVHLRSIGRPGVIGLGSLGHDELDFSALSRLQGEGHLVLTHRLLCMGG